MLMSVWTIWGGFNGCSSISGPEGIDGMHLVKALLSEKSSARLGGLAALGGLVIKLGCTLEPPGKVYKLLKSGE